MKFSDRIELMEQSPIRKLIPFADKAKEKGLNVIHLNIGQPDIATPKEFLEAVNEFHLSVLEYAPSRGIKKTLETIQLYLHNYGLDFDLDEIVITNGASEGLIFSIMAICNPGDEVLTVEPFYPNYKSFATMSSAKLVGIKTGIENNFALPDLEGFEKYITPKTKAILLSNPANPTGRVYSKKEVDTVIELAKKHNLYILADEVYREFNFTDRPFISFADYKDAADRVILLDSISKKYSACGARIGSIASKNREFMGHMMKLCQARLSVSTLDQLGAAAMDIVDDEYVYENRRIYKHRRNILHECLEKIPSIKYSIPEGAFYTILKLPVDNAEKFIVWTLENISIDNTTILLTPADAFYTEPTDGINECRISYCVSDEKIIKALDILALALDKYPGTIR